ncbi:MAG: hypothetical protein ABI585_05015 [Betaproteobacteria bacterium]
MRFTFVVPRLSSLDAALLAESRPLARLASWSQARVEPLGITAALLAAFGAPAADTAHDVPAAPLALLGAGVDPHASFVLAADPVSLVAGRDDVALAARVDDLQTLEAHALVDSLNAHFASDGLVFHAPRPDTWFATLASRPALRTVPIERALGTMLSAHAPGGADAGTWQRWSTEIQMLLFAHPVNRRREQQGRAMCNGTWFWGGGTLADVGLGAPFRVHAPDDRSGDLVRGLALHAGGEAMMLPGSFEAVIEAAPATRPASHVAVVLPPPRDAASLATLEQAWIAPALAWLRSGRIASLVLVTDGERAMTWTARRPSLPARLLSGFAPRRFAIPGR